MPETQTERVALVEAMLRDLAGNPLGVAGRLRADGVRARPFDGRHDLGHVCPLALWLNARTGLAWSVMRRTCQTLDFDLVGMIYLPDELTAFVDAWDAGRHPELGGD